MQMPARDAIESYSHWKARRLLSGYLLLQTSGTTSLSQGLSLCCCDRSFGTLKNPNLSLWDVELPNMVCYGWRRSGRTALMELMIEWSYRT